MVKLLLILCTSVALTACVATPQLHVKHADTTFSLNKSAPKILNLAVSPDMQLLAVHTRGDTFVFWDLATASMIRSLKDKSKSALDDTKIISFSPDNKRLLIGGNYGLESLALPSLSEKQILEKRKLEGIAWIPAGKKILTIGHEFSILGNGDEPTCTNVKDWSNNALTGTFQDCTELIHHQNHRANVAVSPDGKFALTSTPYILYLTDINSGQRIKKNSFLLKETDRNPIIFHSSSWIEFSPDGRHVAMLCGIDKNIHIYELPSLKEVKSIDTISSIFEWPKHMPNKFHYSSDGRTIITGGSEDGEIEYWDTDSGAKIKTIKAHTSSSIVNSVVDLQLSKNGRFLVSGGDASVKIWNYDTGEEVASLIRFEDDEWIVMTPQGYYNASPRGDHYLSATIAGKSVPYEQLRDTYCRPDAVKLSLQALTAPTGESPAQK